MPVCSFKLKQFREIYLATHRKPEREDQRNIEGYFSCELPHPFTHSLLFSLLFGYLWKKASQPDTSLVHGVIILTCGYSRTGSFKQTWI